MARYRPIKGYRDKRADGSPSPTLRVDFWHRNVRVRQDSGCTTERDLQKWANTVREQIDRDSLQASRRSTAARPNLSLKAAMERYRDERRGGKNSWTASAKFLATRLVTEIGETTEIAGIRTSTVMAHVVRLRERGLKASSINQEIALLKTMLNHAREIWEMDLPTIAWRRLMLPVPVRIKNTPTAEQVADLLEASTPRLQRIIEMAVLTGLRHFEIAKVRWTDIQILSPSDGYLTLIGKGDKEVKLPLSSATISLLTSIPRENSLRVFDMTNFRGEWDATRKSVGLSNTRFHDLRHAFATWLDREGVTVQDIKTAMRHSDIATSLIYVDAENRKLLPSLEKVGERLRSAKLKR